jgi:hypothetical protein
MARFLGIGKRSQAEREAMNSGILSGKCGRSQHLAAVGGTGKPGICPESETALIRANCFN